MPPPLSDGGGEHSFLASAAALQDVLLPRLSAAELLRFSLACKAIQAWVLATPPRLWQAGFYSQQHKL